MSCEHKSCKNLIGDGDLFWCYLHRNKWVSLCKAQGIHEIIISEMNLDLLRFQFNNSFDGVN